MQRITIAKGDGISTEKLELKNLRKQPLKIWVKILQF